MRKPGITPEEAVATVLRAYDGCRIQGYDHDYTVAFIMRKFKVPERTVTRALAVREMDGTPVPDYNEVR